MSESDPSWGGRQQRQQAVFPELALGSVDDAFQVDAVRRLNGQSLTSLGQAAEGIFARLPSLLGPIGEIPDAVKGLNRFNQGLLGAFTGATPQQSGSQLFQGLTGQATFRPEDVGFARLMPEGNARRYTGAALTGAANPLNLLGGGGAAANVAAGAGAAIGGMGGSDIAAGLGAPEWAQQAAGLLGGAAGGIAAFGGVKSAVGAAREPVQGVVGSLDVAASPSQKLRAAMQEAKPLQDLNNELLSDFRKTQINARTGAGFGGGEAGAAARMAAMRGTAKRVTFTPLRETLDSASVNDLFDEVSNSPLRGFDSAAAETALFKMMDGIVPPQSELLQLEKVFPGTTRVMRSGGFTGPLDTSKFDQVMNVLSLPRTLKAAADLSATFRHGAIMTVRHPILATESFGKQVKAFFNSEYATALDEGIRSTDNAKLMSAYGRYMSPIEASSAGISAREEQFMSNLAEKIPGIGAIVRGSDRAFGTYLNNMRAGIENQVLDQLTPDQRTPEKLSELAGFLNHVSGRGDLNWLGDHAATVGATFFSPRYFASIPQVHIDAIKAAGRIGTQAARGQILDPVSKEIASSVLGFYLTGVTALGALKLAGAKVGTDPTRSNFGKVQAGNQEIDYWRGHAQVARLVAQLASGKYTSDSTGQSFSQSQVDTLTKFIRTKLSPGLPSIAGDVVAGRNMAGMPLTGDLSPMKNLKQGAQALAGVPINEAVTPLGEIAQQLSFLVLGDIVQGYMADGAKGIALSGVFAGTGMGVTSKEPSPYEQASQTQFGKSPLDLNPNERRQIEASNPDVAKQVSDERMLRGGPAADYEQIKIARQQKLDAIPVDATAAQKRDAMNSINDYARAQRELIVSQRGSTDATASTPDEKALNDWYDAFTKNPDGSVNQEATDQKRADLMATWDDKQREYVDEQTGTADPRLREDLRKIVQTSKDLEKAGFFALRNEQFQRYVAQNNNAPGYKGEPYYTYKDSVVKNWADQYTQQGYQPGIAQQMASDAFDKKYKEFGSWFANTVRIKWEQQHPQLAVDAVNAGYIKPSGKDEVGYINQLSEWLKTRK